MLGQNTDLTIFTNKNEDGIKLSDRLNTVLTNAQYFDVLVGYFRLTGIYLLQEKLEEVDDVRILIVLGTDRDTVEFVSNQQTLEEMSGANATRQVQDNVKQEFANTTDDSIEMENGISRLIDWMKSGKLHIRMCYDRNVHAKVYIVRRKTSKNT